MGIKTKAKPVRLAMSMLHSKLMLQTGPMLHTRIITKENLKKLISKLSKTTEVYAPLHESSDGIIKFRQINNSEDISSMALDKLSYNPAKTAFFKKHETLFEFDNNKVICECVAPKPKILLGLKKCDLNSIAHQDIVFNEAKDCWYMMQRKDAVLIGYHCKNEQDVYCFCNSLDLKDCHDVMLYETKEGYLVEAVTDRGKEFINKFKIHFKNNKKMLNIFADKNLKVIKGADHLEAKNLDERLRKNYSSEEWKKLAEPCLGCSACNILCPSCYCFDIYDKVSMANVKKGKRMREHSSCQLLSFTDIRGKSERASREDRLKHRVYHQLKYFKEKQGVNLCTGCGRCIRHCPVRINFVNIINTFK